jgi:hypothetical protein
MHNVAGKSPLALDLPSGRLNPQLALVYPGAGIKQQLSLIYALHWRKAAAGPTFLHHAGVEPQLALN